METFKAYRIHEIEKKVVARFEELAVEDLDKGEVVVRVAYSSVNYRTTAATPSTPESRRTGWFPCRRE